MTKVIGLLVALAALGAMPAAAFAGGDNTSSGNTQSGTITQGAAGGDSSASGGDGGSGSDGSGGSGGDASSGDGGDAGNQAAIVQQNAGDDANASIDQNQSFGGGDGGDGDDGDDGDGDGDDDGNGNGDDDDDVSGGGTGGGVESVTLARTGFDAWMLALLGGLALAGGIGILAVQRRGGLSA